MPRTSTLALQLIALCAMASPQLAAQAPDATVLLFGAEPTGPSSTQPVFLNGLAAGGDGGWAVAGRIDLGIPFSRSALFGNLSPGGGRSQLLRTPAMLAGWPQLHLIEPSPAGGRLAYIESTQPGVSSFTTGGRSLWIDDQILARSGDSAGVAGRDWYDFRDIFHLVNGDTYVLGQFTDAQGMGDTVARYPGPVSLLSTGDAPTGLPSPVTAIRELRVSPNGAHWIAHVWFAIGARSAIVVDGEVYDFGGGQLAYDWAPAPASLAGPGGTFGTFDSVAINNEGEAAFFCSVTGLANNVGVIVRNRRAVRTAPIGAASDSFEALDPRGFIATLGPSSALEVSVESLPVVAAGSTVDIDADGTVDPGWSLLPTVYSNKLAFSSDGARLLWRGQLQGPSGEQPFVVARLERYGAAQAICDAQSNSTGHPAQLTALGSREVPAGDLTLACIDLPDASVGMFLVSQTTGFQPNAGGSAGDLCLDGAIGRYNQVPFFSATDGRAELTLDLLAIPQPTGAVPASAGSTWYFQSWYRDASMGQPTSNFSDAVRVQLR